MIFDNNLNAAVARLRQTLGDSADRPRYIETVPRLGYRFAAPIERVSADHDRDAVTAALAPAATMPGTHSPALVPAADCAAPNRPAPATNAWWAIASYPAMRVGFTVALIALTASLVSVAEWPWPSRASRSSAAALERGRELLARGEVKAATVELQRSIALDPRHAVAHSTLAHALHKSSNQALVDRPATSPSVEEAERAVAIDPECGACHGTLGFFLFYHSWQWQRAEEHLRKAIALEPGTASIRPSYAMLLLATGRMDDALTEIDAALQQRPYETVWHVIRASILYASRRYDEAIAAADKALALDDRERGAWEWRSRALFQVGRGEEAIHAIAQVAFAPHAGALEAAVLQDGWPGGLRTLLEVTGDWQARYEQSWRRGPWRALLRDDAGALDEVERAFQRRNYNLMYLAVDPVFDHLRSQPRFQRVLKDMGLADVVRASTR